MTTAVDSSVILDAMAEWRPVFKDRSTFEQFMADWGLEFVPVWDPIS